VAEDSALETRACDFRSNWMTAVEALDADTYLGAENSYNLFALRKNSDAAADEDRSRLEARRPLGKPPASLAPGAGCWACVFAQQGWHAVGYAKGLTV